MVPKTQSPILTAESTASCTCSREFGCFVIRVAGSVDLAAVEGGPFAATLSSYRSDEPLDVALDLGDVTFLDSSGLSWLIAVRSAAAIADRKVRIRRSSPLVSGILEMAGLRPFFPLESRTI